MSLIDLQDPKYYTETFNKVKPCFFEESRFSIVMGGSNSSKSYSMYQRFIHEFFVEKAHDYLVLRKYGTSLYNSVFQGMRNIITEFGIDRFFKVYESPGKLTIKNVLTGRRMIFLGSDDPEKLKSIVNIKYCLIEEASEFSLSDFLEINRRLRGFEGIKLFLIFNPISRLHWINKHFFLTASVAEKTRFIHCTYQDNRFATKEDIEQLEGLKYIDENDYRVYCLGEWGVLSSRIIFKNWKIVDEIPIDAKEIPCGMDFGYSPDPTTLTDIRIKGGQCFVDELIYDSGLVNIYTENSLGDSIQSRLEQLHFPKDRTIIADSAGSVSIREIRDAGYDIFAVKKPGINESLKVMKSYQIMVTRRSLNLIREFENYMLKIDRNGVILPEPIDTDNHGIDGIRYSLFMKGRMW